MANLGIKIKVDYSSIDDLAKKINQLTKDKLEIDLTLNTNKATEKLTTFKSKYDQLKTYMKDGLDLKFDSNGSFDKAFQNMKTNADKVSGSISDIQKQANEMNEKFKGSDGSLSTMARTVKTLANGAKQTTDSITKNMSSYQKTVETVVDGEKKSVKTTTDKKMALKEIASVMSEIGSLNTKSLTADSRSNDAIKDRILILKSQLMSLQTQYKDIFKEDSGKSDIVAQTSALNAYNQEIKRASIEKQKQAQFDKETESIIKQIVQLENERYRLLKQSDSVGDNEASVLRKQADAIKEKSAELSKQQGLAERMNSTQAQSLSNLQKENEVAREYSSTLSRAKDVDSARVKAQANAYREIKSQMQDVYSIQEKITQLTALEKNGTLTGKEETKLQSLRQELSVRQDIMTATKNQHNAEGNLTSTQKDSLSALQKEKSYKLESARAMAEINAEARKTDQLYDEIASSMKKVHTLSNELANAGASESRVIRNIIGLEESRQNAVRETLAMQGRINNSREDELNTIRKQNRELQEQNSERSTTRRYDNLTTGGGMLGGMLNPMSIANDARQAAMTFYDSIAPIDAALVNIAKVAEEPQEQLDAFATTIYDTASTVGKSAEEYATSVERWLTAGKSLSDSVELSKTSVMGAFVGNVGESEMVDYMSVPLNAYKKNALEANDIINAMNEVANKNAIEMDDMGSAYKRAASTSAQAGTSFAQLTGLIAAGQEATRVGGETMGTAIKAMDVNLGKIGSGITKGDVRKSEFLKNIGVDVKDANGELKSTYQVLGDLNKVWKNLNTNQKSTAGFYLAGKQFQNVFSGIMGNWDVVLKATNEAQGQVDLIDKKSGSAFKEFEKQQDSVQFKAANLKNSWAEFLNTVAGGKDGVVTVMAALNDGLQMATKLAENDSIRGIATNLLKVIATLTATTAISKFFSVITAGSRSTIASLKGVTEGLRNARAASSISKASKASKATQVATTSNKSFRLSRKSEAVGKATKSYKAVEDVGDIDRSASSIKNVSNTVEKTTKATKGLGTSLLSVGAGVASVGSKFVSFGAKAIPVVGGVFTAIEVLEAFGVPVWGTLFKAVKKFTGGTDEAKESLKSYQVQQESTKQSLSENKLFTGAIKKNNDLIKSYKEMADAKKKSLEERSQQNGLNPGDVDRNLNLNSDEFENLKKQFNDRAAELGISTRITINNWEDIQAKFKELEEVNIKVTGVEVSKLGGDLKKLGLYDNVEKQFDAFNKKSQSEMDKKVKRYEGSKKYVSAGSDESKYYDQQIKEAERYKEGKGDFYGSGEMKKMEKATKERLETLNSTREAFYGAMNQGTLNDTFSTFDADAQKQTIAILASKLPLLAKQNKQYAETNQLIEQGGSLSTKQYNELTKAGIKLGSLSEDTGTWYDELVRINGGYENAEGVKVAQEQYQALINSVKELGTKSNESQANLENNLRALGKTAGMSEDDINYMMNLAKKGGAEYIEYMARFGDMGASIVGVTAKIQAAASQYGTTWSEIAVQAQKSVDIISQMDGGKDKLLRFKIINEDGSVNFDKIDDVYAFPDEVRKTFNLVNTETGEINIAQVTAYLEKVNSQENKQYMLQLGVEGDIDMDMISKIYALDPEVTKKFKIINEETGEIDWKSFAEQIKNLPPETVKKFKFNTDVNKDGKTDLNDTLNILKNLSESDLKEITTKVKTEVKGQDELEKARKEANELDGKEYTVVINAKDHASRVTKLVKDNAEKVNGNYTAFLEANKDNANTSIEDIQAKLAFYNTLSPEAKMNANNQDALTKYAEAHGLVVDFDGTTGMATFKANKSEVDTAAADVDTKTQNRTSISTFRAVLDGAWETVKSLFGMQSKSITLSANVVKKDGSVGIQTGSSFSASVGSQIGTSQSSSIDSATSKYSSDNQKPATVNEDVWRYWSKELFEEMPLQNSLDKLKDSIDAAGEDQNKLISLYKQQITQYDRQIAYQKGLGGAYQDEMNSVLGQLRGKGFNSNGNKITNLGHAKSLSGDNASESETLLNKWKELYNSINETQKTINDLNASKRQAEEQIKDADTARELKKIEGILKRTEALLKSVENNTSIQDVKEGFLGSGDYELNLNIKEQGLNSSINNVNSLIDEYNKLSTTSIAYAENAEQVQSTLENLKSTILSNADSIIQYRESLNSIRIDRLVSDYEAYSQVINDSISRIGNSIDDLKEGLISGTTLSDLYSSQLGTFDLTRKTKLEQEHENRLNLESELDAALDGFAKKNVERTQNVSNQILTIEKAKYQNLLRLAQDYTNGKPLTISTATVDNIGIGITGSTNKDKTQYNSWADNLKKITKSYNDAYTQMVAKYDNAIKKAKTSSEKDLLTNQMIIDQLQLQEDMYKKMIDTNNQMITQSKVELENLTLTTEQRQKLEDAIKEYQQANIDAQKSIKESISARYEFEFDLIDKAMDKASKYSENLNYLLNVSELINMSSSSKQSLYEAIFAGKINEYSKAKKNLESLVSEQKKFEEGSYEWGLLQTKIDDVRGSLHDLTADALNANKDLLENNLSSVQEKLEKGLLNGKTLEDWKEYQDSWTTGIAKELELEAIRKRMVGLEDDVLNKRLEALDRQEAVSKKDIEYLDKQSKILELQSKLNNISKERSVQTLVRGDNGKWAWQYVADQSEYDSTKKDLDDAKKELEEFKSSQRAGYVEDLGGIIDEAKDGKYSSPEELTNALSDLNSVYGNILTDIPNLNFGSIDDIVSAYQNYLTANKLIAGDAIGAGTALTQQTIDNIGLKFESSFMNIADKLGEIIGTELRNALGMLNGKQVGANGNYVIQNQELQFPNVTDANGIEEVFKDLPSVTEQLTLKK